jgi:hypothetical protein
MGYRCDLGCRRWCDGGKELSDRRKLESLRNPTGAQDSYNGDVYMMLRPLNVHVIQQMRETRRRNV